MKHREKTHKEIHGIDLYLTDFTILYKDLKLGV